MQGLTIQPEQRMSESEFEDLCRRFPDMNVEMTREGKIRMMTPAGNRSSQANMEILGQLWGWWRTHRLGAVFDSNTLFTLPDGSKLGPDAAYITNERLAELPGGTIGDGFGKVCPNFVIELLSKRDSLGDAQEKMRNWRANGVELGWLVDPYRRTVYVYTPEREPATHRAATLDGIGPVAGFTLDLAEVWSLY